MSQSAIKQEQPTPLESLSSLLDEDMRQVNAVILDRMQSPVALIPQLASYLIAAGGKRIRPLLTLACAQIFNADMDNVHKLAASVEFIHTATLLHDDVVDESLERRGKETANLVFGNQASVLVGDFLFSRAFELMTETENVKVLKILANASSIITQGEVLQLSAMQNIDTSMNDYIEIITSKTAALFAASCEVGPVLADASKEETQSFYDYGLYLGIAFQIADDTLDYNADAASLGKTVGDDFREGKITAPVLYALEAADEKERAFWQRTIAENNQKDGDLEKAQEIIARHNCIQKSHTLAENYAQRAQEALNSLPQNETALLLKDLVSYTIQRKS